MVFHISLIKHVSAFLKRSLSEGAGCSSPTLGEIGLQGWSETAASLPNSPSIGQKAAYLTLMCGPLLITNSDLHDQGLEWAMGLKETLSFAHICSPEQINRSAHAWNESHRTASGYLHCPCTNDLMGCTEKPKPTTWMGQAFSGKCHGNLICESAVLNTTPSELFPLVTRSSSSGSCPQTERGPSGSNSSTTASPPNYLLRPPACVCGVGPRWFSWGPHGSVGPLASPRLTAAWSGWRRKPGHHPSRPHTCESPKLALVTFRDTWWRAIPIPPLSMPFWTVKTFWGASGNDGRAFP